ncbi:MAG: hypothetical protein ACOZAR_04090 [Patescibacteria group bacterium]
MIKANTFKKIFFSFLLLIGIIVICPQPSRAQTNNNLFSSFTIIAADKPVEVRAQLPTSSDNKYSSLSEYVKDFYIFAIWLITGISIIMIVYGGYTMIISSGNPEMINKGKNTIISALVSLALLVLAYTVLRIISPQIINNPKPEPSTSSQTTQPNNYSGTNEGTGNPLEDGTVVPGGNPGAFT